MLPYVSSEHRPSLLLIGYISSLMPVLPVTMQASLCPGVNWACKRSSCLIMSLTRRILHKRLWNEFTSFSLGQAIRVSTDLSAFPYTQLGAQLLCNIPVSIFVQPPNITQFPSHTFRCLLWQQPLLGTKFCVHVLGPLQQITTSWVT